MTKWQKYLFGAMLSVYMLVLVWVILLHATLETLHSAGDPLFRSINLYLYFNGTESLLNMLVFVPLGVYIETLWAKGQWWRKAALVMATTLLFEVVQYIFALGSSDIMDILNNSLGGFAGLAVGLIARKVLGNRFYTAALPVAAICTVGMLAVVHFVPLR